MKRVFLIVIILLVLAFVPALYDGLRVSQGNEPQLTVKSVSDDGSKITYWGLGYKVDRYIEVRPTEPYSSNTGVKMGAWFTKLAPPAVESIVITNMHTGNSIQLENDDTLAELLRILEGQNYDSGICQSITSHTISVGKDFYIIDQQCSAVQLRDRQATPSQQDFEAIVAIISGC